MSERLFGIETEYALVSERADHLPARKASLTRRLLSRAHAALPCVPDAFGNGVFLQNGGRFYIDCGAHPEMTTPEVANPWDAVRYLLAGERMLERIAGLGDGDDDRLPLMLFKSNIDYVSGTTWGCHESVLHHTDPAALAAQVIPHLVSRIVFTGAGGFDARSPGLRFMLSPRAAFLAHPVSSSSTCNRGIFHTKNESLAGDGYGRLHILCGESLSSETAAWLKVATTVLVVALVEGGATPGAGLELADALDALHTVATDVTCRMPLLMADGSKRSALEIQRRYLERAERYADAPLMPPWAAIACRYWRGMLDALETNASEVATTLDWAIKRALFEQHAARRGFSWESMAAWSRVLEAGQRSEAGQPLPVAGPPAGVVDALLELLEPPRDLLPGLESLWNGERLPRDKFEPFLLLRQELLEADMRFAQLGGRGIFDALDRSGALTHHFPGVDNIPHAIENPPAIGRARVRGEVIRRGAAERRRYRAYWDHVLDLGEGRSLDLSNPFETVERWSARQFPSEPRSPAAPDSTALRDQAYDCYLSGAHGHAVEILRELVARRFDVAGTHCHLARSLLMDNRRDEARREVARAWDLRTEAPRYVVCRTLWLRALFAALDGGDALPLVGRIKALLAADASSDWTIEPVIDHLRPELPGETCELLARVAAALSDARCIAALERVTLWRACEPLPLE